MWINNSFPNNITNYLGLGAGVFIVGGEEAQLDNINNHYASNYTVNDVVQIFICFGDHRSALCSYFGSTHAAK